MEMGKAIHKIHTSLPNKKGLTYIYITFFPSLKNKQPL